MDNIDLQKIVCFGEILWDVLPSGMVPGGAPMNVAYHLKKLGNDPIVISKVGVDEPGQKLFTVMEGFNMCTDFFQISNQLQTGKVNAKILPDNEVIYDIIHPVAWDDIEWQPEFDSLLKETKTFVYGSLSARCGGTKSTLYKFLENTKAFKVLDINLRFPHYNRKIIEYLLSSADLLKLNQSELELITGWFVTGESLENRIRVLQEKFNIPIIVVTRGSNGALLNKNGDIYNHPGFTVNVADTIGSGDAFLAGMIDQLQLNKLPAETLSYASALGALVASCSGACPSYNIAEIDALIAQNVVTN